MGRRNKRSKQRRVERRFRVRGVRRDQPDVRKLGKALISLAQAEAEKQARAEYAARQQDDAPADARADDAGPADGDGHG